MNAAASRLRIGTRASRLARAQAQLIKNHLLKSDPSLEIEIHTISTEGDRTLDRALPDIGGKGLFTLEIENALLEESVDLAVHSLKDLPTDEPEGLAIGAIPDREDPRDVLVAADGHDLSSLPSGATVGTSSPRRRAQIRALRPDLNVAWIRGNVETRIEKVERGDYDAAVLASAGILRLGLEAKISQWFETATLMPAPGQAALAVQCRKDDPRVMGLLASIDDPETRSAVTAERAFLATLESGCSAPVGALGTARNGEVNLEALVASETEARSIRLSGRGDDPTNLGRRLGMQALSEGAGELVNDRS